MANKKQISLKMGVKKPQNENTIFSIISEQPSNESDISLKIGATQQKSTDQKR